MQNRLLMVALFLASPLVGVTLLGQIGSERAIPVHLQDDQEFAIPLRDLIRFCERLFTAMWTIEDGGGRPLSKGTGSPLSDMNTPLVFPRNFNRVSSPDTNSCSGCHNKPFVGGGGDIVGNVFVLGQRFDFATFDAADSVPTRGTARDTRTTERASGLAAGTCRQRSSRHRRTKNGGASTAARSSR